MDYLTHKEARVEKAWGKRGLAGLRSDLLQRIGEPRGGWNLDSDDGEGEMSNEDTREVVVSVARMVYGALPAREWSKADIYIAETCGLVGVDSSEWVSEVMQVRQAEEVLREDEGSEEDWSED